MDALSQAVWGPEFCSQGHGQARETRAPTPNPPTCRDNQPQGQFAEAVWGAKVTSFSHGGESAGLKRKQGNSWQRHEPEKEPLLE